MNVKKKSKIILTILLVISLLFFSYWKLFLDNETSNEIKNDMNGNGIEDNGILYEELFSINYNENLYLFIKTCDWKKDIGRTNFRTIVKCYNRDSILDVTNQFVENDHQIIYPKPFVYNNKLYIARWSTKYGVVLKTFDGNKWSEPFNSSSLVPINNGLSTTKAYIIGDITFYNNKIYFIWVKENNNGIFVQTFNGSYWSNVDFIEWDGLYEFDENMYKRHLIYPPRTAIFKEKMCVICSIGTHENERYISIRYLDNDEWSVPIEQSFPNNYYSKTILDFKVFRNNLTFFWHDINGDTSDIHINMICYDLNNWSNSTNISDFSNQVFNYVINEYPTMTIYDNRLFVSWRISNGRAISCGGGNDPMYLYVRYFDDKIWDSPINLSSGNWRETIVFNNKLYVVDKNDLTINCYDGENWIVIKPPLNGWVRDLYLTIFQDKLFFIVREDNSIWSLNIFDGSHWFDKILVTS